jgi:hypothetical protein
MCGDFSAWRNGKPRWLDPVEILRSLTSVANGAVEEVVCILDFSEDMMMGDFALCRQLTVGYQNALRGLQKPSRTGVRRAADDDSSGAGFWKDGCVCLIPLKYAGHHVQNDVPCDLAA